MEPRTMSPYFKRALQHHLEAYLPKYCGTCNKELPQTAQECDGCGQEFLMRYFTPTGARHFGIDFAVKEAIKAFCRKMTDEELERDFKNYLNGQYGGWYDWEGREIKGAEILKHFRGDTWEERKRLYITRCENNGSALEIDGQLYEFDRYAVQEDIEKAFREPKKAEQEFNEISVKEIKADVWDEPEGEDHYEEENDEEDHDHEEEEGEF